MLQVCQYSVYMQDGPKYFWGIKLVGAFAPGANESLHNK